MLPLSWQGRVALPPEAGDDPERVLDRLEAALVGARARALRRERGAVAFEGGSFRLVSNWNLLAPISFGRLDVERGPEGIEVRYHITFEEVVAFATLGCVFMAVTLFFLTPGPDMGAVPYVVPVVGWAWLVGGNIAVTLVRFPAFVHRVSVGAEDTGRAA
jgi:hypothetical protein